MLRNNRWAAGLAAVVIAVAGSFAWAAGMFQGLPIQGGSSYCSGSSTGSSGSQVCVSTVPAGPTVYNGNELIPADTQTAGGVAPQTVLLPQVLLGPGLISYTVGQDQVVQTITNNVGTLVITGTGGINKMTFTMPSAPADGQRLRIASEQTITTLALSANTNQTIALTPTALTASQTLAGNYELIFRRGDVTAYGTSLGRWYRLQ